MSDKTTANLAGLQIAEVTKLEPDPEDEFRVEVLFPGPENKKVWAKLANVYATSGSGAFFYPEIGDNVIIGFLNNDPEHPVILGSLFSTKKEPPFSLENTNYKKAIVSKSKITIEFDDEDKVLVLKTPGGNSVTISDKAKAITLEDQNRNKIEMSSSGINIISQSDINFSAKGNINFSAASKINMEAKNDLNISGMNVNGTAQVGITMKGNATAEMSASGQTVVKGGIVMIN